MLPDLIDFGQVNYAKIGLSYDDPANGVHETGEILFVADAEDAALWRVPLKDERHNAYQWRATFFLADGTTQETAPVTTSDLTVIPQAAF